MNETVWTHLSIAAVPTLMILGFWFDSHRQRDRQHQENRERLTAIETMLEPMWNWFNNGRSKK